MTSKDERLAEIDRKLETGEIFSDEDYELLGKMIQESPELRDKLAAVAASRIKRVPLKPPTDHDFRFKCSGKKGDIVLVRQQAGVLFKGMKLIAFDTSGKETGTRIRSFKIGGVDQFPPMAKDGEGRPGFWTSEFRADSLSSGMKCKTISPAEEFEFEIEFMEDCEWEAVLVGRMCK